MSKRSSDGDVLIALPGPVARFQIKNTHCLQEPSTENLLTVRFPLCSSANDSASAAPGILKLLPDGDNCCATKAHSTRRTTGNAITREKTQPQLAAVPDDRTLPKIYYSGDNFYRCLH